LIGSNESKLPDYMHISYEIKLFASFVLGLKFFLRLQGKLSRF